MSVSVENPRINIRICKKLPQFIAFCIIMEHPETNITEETRIPWRQTVSVGYPPAGHKTQVFFHECNTFVANFTLDWRWQQQTSVIILYTQGIAYCISPIPCIQLISKHHTLSTSILAATAAFPEKLLKPV